MGDLILLIGIGFGIIITLFIETVALIVWWIAANREDDNDS